MPYDLKTKDGIFLRNIPDELDPNSDQVKQRVLLERDKVGQQPHEQPITPQPTPTNNKGPAFGTPAFEAYARGDVQAGKFLEEDQRIKGSREPVTDIIGKAKNVISDTARRVGFEFGRRGENIKDSITGEKRKTSLSSTPELGRENQYSSQEGFEEFAGKWGIGRTKSIKDAIRAGFYPPDDPKTASVLRGLPLMGSDAERIDAVASLKKNGKVTAMFPDEKGNVYALFDNGFLGQINRPGTSGMDIQEFGQKGLTYAAASMIGGPTVTGQVAASLGAAGALELDNLASGGSFDEYELALAPVFEVLGQGAGKIISKAFTKMSPSARRGIQSWEDLEGKIPPNDWAKIEKAMKASDALDGSPKLTKDQILSTGKPVGKEFRDVKKVIVDPENADKLAERYMAQDSYGDAKVRKIVEDSFSPTGMDAGKPPIEIGMERTRKAADGVFEQIDTKRVTTAKETYGRLWGPSGLGNQVNLRPVRARVRSILADEAINAGEKEAVQKRVLDFMKHKPPGELAAINLSTVTGKRGQETVWEIDRLINGRGADVVGEKAKSSLRDVRKLLIDEIEKTNPGFKAANSEYRTMMKEAEEVEETLVGLLRDTEEAAQDKVARIFNQKSNESILKAKGMLDSVDPSAYPALYRGWVEERLSKLPDTIQMLESDNAADIILNRFYGNPGQSRKMIALAPNLDTKKNLTFLRDWLNNAKQLRVSQATSEPSKGIARDIDIARGVIVPQAEAAIMAKRGIFSFFGRRFRAAFTEAMLNPKWAEEMKIIRKKGPKENGLLALIEAITTSTEAIGSGAMTSLDPEAELESQPQDNQSTQ
jgi:hypothetical protein